MKKAIAVLLSMCLLLSAAACGSGSGTAATDNAGTAQNEAAPEAVPEAATEAAPEATAEAAPEATAETAPEATAETAPEPEPEPVNPAGSYKLTGITSASGTNMEVIATLVNMGINCYLFLEEDGTGAMNFMEAKLPLEWNEESLMMQPAADNPDQEVLAVPYTYEDGSLAIRTSEYSMEFTAMTEEELADYEANGAETINGLVSTMAQNLLNSVGEDLFSILFFAMGSGLEVPESEPIPEGEPSEGPVTGEVSGFEFSVLGADQIESGGSDLIVFYYDVKCVADVPNPAWYLTMEASQDGSFLEEIYDEDTHEQVPEIQNIDFSIAPGRTLRCANVFAFNPNGGTVGFRLSSHEDENTVLYYTDPKNLSGAPEPFVLGSDPSIPEYLDGYPEENEDVHIDSAEYYTNKNGSPCVRISFRFKNNDDKNAHAFNESYTTLALQDGVGMNIFLNHDDEVLEDNLAAEVAPGEEVVIVRSFKVRTDSPIAFVVESYENWDFDTRQTALVKVFEVK